MARRIITRTSRPKTKKVWVGVNLGSQALTASTGSVLGSLNAAALALRPFTILRTRLELYYVTDQQAASETGFGVHAGIVVNDKAAAVGVTAVPLPVTNNDDDFFSYQPVSFRLIFTTGVGHNQVGWRYTVDSKAMRKVLPAQDVVFVFEQTAAVGATIVTMGRFLVQLH